MRGDQCETLTSSTVDWVMTFIPVGTNSGCRCGWWRADARRWWRRLAQSPPLGVRVGAQERVDHLPQQAHQHIRPASPARSLDEQLVGQRPAQFAVLGTQQAMVGQAQRLDQGHGIRRGPRLVQDGQRRGMLAGSVVGLGSQPHAQAQCDGACRVDQPQRVLQARPKPSRRGRGAMLVHPQTAKAQRGLAITSASPVRSPAP
jgi:hypothetical protein